MRIITVSNRLPVSVEREEAGLRITPASGGLVSALGPVLTRRGGLWIGWPGTVGTDVRDIEAELSLHGRDFGFELKPVSMSKEDVEGFYQGFSNEIIWPLFHDLQSRCNFVPDYWTRYIAIRHAFADVVLEHVQPEDFVWVQDYHLMGMGRRLRERGLGNRMGFFLHIPFPPPDIFCKLPWRNDVLEGLLHHDLIGFQTPHDVENFLDCVQRLLPTAKVRRRQRVIESDSARRRCAVGAFPIGIDFQQFAKAAAGPEVTARTEALRADMPNQQIILGVDRLDYTKGIPYRLRAFQLALRRYPELHRAVTLLQVVVPSREAVPQYQDLKAEIERLVTQVNGEFTQPGWVPIHHVFRSLEWLELLAYYRVADVALVTPLKDGMNLVAKEYCACQVEGNGVLILSEFAGAAVQLHRDAIVVNPYDLEGTAEAIRHAVAMTPGQRRAPMNRLRGLVRRQDVHAWARRFLAACGVREDSASCAPSEAAPESRQAGDLELLGHVHA